MYRYAFLALLSSSIMLSTGFRVKSRVRHNQNRCTVKDPPGPTYSGLEYVLKGYNIFFGNALDAKFVDPGFTTYAGSHIFQITYCDGTRSADGKYYIPDRLSLSPRYGCSLGFNSDTVKTSQQYTETMKTKVKITGGYAGSSFSASTAYKRFKKFVENETNKHISSTAECSVFFAKSQAYLRPRFTPNFQAATESLNDRETYFDLFDNFGTHYVRSATMGARYGFTSYLTENSWEKLERHGIEVELAASYSAKFSVGGEFSFEREREWAETFSREQLAREEITIGSKPTNGDQQAWLGQVSDNPMPISYHIESICSLLPDEKQIPCKEAQDSYCSERLLPLGLVDTCLSPDQIRDAMWKEWLKWSIWKHSGPSCVHPDRGSDWPRDGTKLVYHNDCSDTSRQAIIFNRVPVDDQYFVIQHKSGKCVHPHMGAYDNPDNTKLVLFEGCETTSIRLQFRMLPAAHGRFVIQHHSGKCVHPYGGKDAPAWAFLVLHSDCDTRRPANLVSFDKI